MLSLQCRACSAPLDSNHWVETIQDYNDLCPTCLESISIFMDNREVTLGKDAVVFLEQHAAYLSNNTEEDSDGGEGQ